MNIKIEEKQIKSFIKTEVQKRIKKIVLITFISIIVAVLSMINPLIEEFLIDKGLLDKNLYNLLLTLSLFIISMIGINFLSSMIGIIQENLVLEIEKEMKVKAFKHALSLELIYIRKNGFFKIIEDAEYDISRISQILAYDLISIFWQIFTFVGCVIGLFIVHGSLTLVLLLSIPAKYLIYYITNSKRKEFSEALLSINRKISKWKNGIYDAINEIKLWNLYQKETDILNELYSESNSKIRKLFRLDTFMDLSMNAIDSIFNGVVILYGGWLIWNGKLTIGALFAFISYMTYFVSPVFFIINLKRTISKIKPSIKSYLEYMNLKEEDYTKPLDDLIHNEIKYYPLFFEFKNVSFSFDNKSVFKDLNLKFRSGEIIKIEGENGSGKSTFINLLLKLYSPDSGSIYLNGVDIKNIPNDIYREIFAVMYQSVFLFDGTINENISMYEIFEDKFDGKELLNFAEKFPAKLDTDVGINGTFLSGGEKQRVALVRTINKKSRILIMDEGTSNCDIETKKYVNRFLESGKFELVFIIAHSNSDMSQYNRILTIKNGIVLEKGRK